MSHNITFKNFSPAVFSSLFHIATEVVDMVVEVVMAAAAAVVVAVTTIPVGAETPEVEALEIDVGPGERAFSF